MGGLNVSFRLDKKRLLNLNSATFGPLIFLIREENKKNYVYKKAIEKDPASFDFVLVITRYPVVERVPGHL